MQPADLSLERWLSLSPSEGSRLRSSVADTVGALAPRAKTLVISTTTNPTYGTILVSGKTLYTLKTGKTSCSTSCLKVWPEVLLPKGVKKAKAGRAWTQRSSAPSSARAAHSR